MRVEVLVTECTVREAIESPGDMGYMPRMRRSQLINGNELGWSRTHSINDSVRKVMFGFMIVYAVSVIYLFSDTLQAWSLENPFTGSHFQPKNASTCLG